MQQPRGPVPLDIASRMREYSIAAKQLLQQQRENARAICRAKREALEYEHYKIKNRLVDMQEIQAAKDAMYKAGAPPQVQRYIG